MIRIGTEVRVIKDEYNEWAGNSVEQGMVGKVGKVIGYVDNPQPTLTSDEPFRFKVQISGRGRYLAFKRSEVERADRA